MTALHSHSTEADYPPPSPSLSNSRTGSGSSTNDLLIHHRSRPVPPDGSGLRRRWGLRFIVERTWSRNLCRPNLRYSETRRHFDSTCPIIGGNLPNTVLQTRLGSRWFVRGQHRLSTWSARDPFGTPPVTFGVCRTRVSDPGRSTPGIV